MSKGLKWTHKEFKFLLNFTELEGHKANDHDQWEIHGSTLTNTAALIVWSIICVNSVAPQYSFTGK